MLKFFGVYITYEKFGYICMGIALTLYLIWVIKVVKARISSYTPLETYKLNKSLAKFSKSREDQIKAKSKRLNSRKTANLFKKFKLVPYSEHKLEEIDILIKKLDKRDKDGILKTADEYYVLECLLFYGIGLISVLGMLFVADWMVFGILLALVVSKLPAGVLRKEMKDEIVEIEKQMPEFISMFYYRFRDPKMVLRLDQLIDDYRPLANPSMIRLLSSFDLDIRNLDDETAIKRLQERYAESNYVYSFCSVALGMWKQQQNAYIQLSNLYNELKIIREQSFEKQLKMREERVEQAFTAIFLLFAIEMMIFIIFQIGAV